MKPENILLVSKSNDTHVKLCDFGYSLLFPIAAMKGDGGERHVLHDAACGTHGYVAPEVLDRDEHSFESDWYSLGITAFVLLCGYLPPATFRETPSLHLLEGDIYWKGVSRRAKEFVVALLQRDPLLRMTGEAVLAHPWLQGQRESPIGKLVTNATVFPSAFFLK